MESYTETIGFEQPVCQYSFFVHMSIVPWKPLVTASSSHGSSKLTCRLILVEFVKALCLTVSLSKRLEEASVAEDEHVTNLLTKGSRQTD